MTTAQARKILRRYNAWRRGPARPMQNPTLIGQAIDVAVHALAEHKQAMETLRLIAGDKRHTREQRLASACITLLDELNATLPDTGAARPHGYHSRSASVDARKLA